MVTSEPKQPAEEMQLCIGYSCNFYKTALKIRNNPMSFVPALEKQMSFFKGKTLNDPSVIDPFAYSRGNSGDGIMTYEGKAAWESAITSLEQQGQVGSVWWSDGLSLVAGDVCANSSKVRGDGKSVWQRAERYGLVTKPQESVSQYGAPDAERSVLDLYIDDGLNPRFNRLALINEGVSMMGVANCRHNLTNARIVVAVFANGFKLNDYGKKRVKVAQELLKQEKMIATATKQAKKTEEKKTETKTEEKKADTGRKLFNKTEFMNQLNNSVSLAASFALAATALLAL